MIAPTASVAGRTNTSKNIPVINAAARPRLCNNFFSRDSIKDQVEITMNAAQVIANMKGLSTHRLTPIKAPMRSTAKVLRTMSLEAVATC
jgi:hypothetical protein